MNFSRDSHTRIIKTYEVRRLFSNVDAVVPAALAFQDDLQKMWAGGRAAEVVGDLCLDHVRSHPTMPADNFRSSRREGPWTHTGPTYRTKMRHKRLSMSCTRRTSSGTTLMYVSRAPSMADKPRGPSTTRPESATSDFESCSWSPCSESPGTLCYGSVGYDVIRR